MLYRKNVGTIEGGIRMLGGVLLAGGSLWGFGATPLGWGLAASGATLVVTGLVGWCPACALAGRRPAGERP